LVSFQDEALGLRYLRVANSLRERVLEGVYQPGERLPRQHDLAREYNVAFTTLKRALDILETEGFVVRKIGQGTYAALPQKHTPSALVVEDDENIRTYFARTLETSGWESVLAESGEMALEMMEERKFDIIFLDLFMPDMSGVAAFRAIRQVDADVYVVVITGYPDSDLMWEALEIGPFAVMKKPISPDELRAVLANVIQPSGTTSISE